MSETDHPAKPSRIHMRGFASISPERRAEIASMGGKSVAPGNRAYSRNRELARAAGKKGGEKSRRGKGKAEAGE